MAISRVRKLTHPVRPHCHDNRLTFMQLQLGRCSRSPSLRQVIRSLRRQSPVHLLYGSVPRCFRSLRRLAHYDRRDRRPRGRGSWRYRDVPRLPHASIRQHDRKRTTNLFEPNVSTVIIVYCDILIDVSNRGSCDHHSGLIWGIGTVVGPVVGGGFDKISWRWAFYINLIIGGIFVPACVFILPSFDPLPKTPIRARIVSFDFLGSLLSCGLFLAIIMAINFGGVLYQWMSGEIMALFVVGGGLCIVFALQQGFEFLTDRSSRVFPMHFLRSKEPVLLFVACAAVNAAGFIPVYYIPIYFQFTKGDDSIQSAVRLLPLIFTLSFFILLNGGVMSKFGYYQPWYVFGSALLVVGGALLCKWTTRWHRFDLAVGSGLTKCAIQTQSTPTPRRPISTGTRYSSE